jgi:hypothetical protein
LQDTGNDCITQVTIQDTGNGCITQVALQTSHISYTDTFRFSHRSATQVTTVHTTSLFIVPHTTTTGLPSRTMDRSSRRCSRTLYTLRTAGPAAYLVTKRVRGMSGSRGFLQGLDTARILLRRSMNIGEQRDPFPVPMPYKACPCNGLGHPAAEIQRAPAEAPAQPSVPGVKPCQAAGRPLMRQGADPISSNSCKPLTLLEAGRRVPQPIWSKELGGM